MKEDMKKFGAGATRRQVITVIALVVMVWGVYYFTKLSAGYDGGEAVWVHIPASATADDVRDSLRTSLGNSFGSTVGNLWNGNVAASHGAYRIEPGEKAWAIARRIGKGRQTPIKLTFNNLRTSDQLAERLGSVMEFTPDEFKAAMTGITEKEGIAAEELEAQFLPDTYEVYWTSTPEELTEKIRDNYRRFWTDERQAKAKAEGLTPLQASVLASIVEEESNRRDERGKIARLYLNRLDKGMRLQADPTVKFATGDFAAKRITGDMLKVDSPYNTYIYKGLPPGVIRLPEAATIEQVISAPSHDYIYMCARADGSGYHDFTSSYSDHLTNAAAFRKAAYK